MHKVVSAEPLPGYRLNIRFADGLQGVVDLSDMVGKGVFQSWTDPEEFGKVFVDPETNTVAWPNGADLCPDSLHQDISEQEKAA